jgi:hypothetical protein
MRRIVTAGLLAGATAAVVVGGTLVSYASWIVPGPAAPGKAAALSMPAGVTPDSEIRAGKTVVTWKAQTIIPGVRMTAYLVTAHDTDRTPRRSITRSVTASGSDRLSAVFSTAELTGGRWRWTVTPKLRSWTGAEGPLSDPALHLAVPTPATAPAKAETAGDASRATVSSPAAPTPAADTSAEPTAAPAEIKSDAYPTPSTSPSVVDPLPSGVPSNSVEP